MKNTRAVASIISIVFATSILSAAQLYWDPGMTLGASLGGAGSWNTSSTQWFPGAPIAPDVAWNNAGNNDAEFTGAGGTVTLTQNINAGNLYFTNLTGSVSINSPVSGAETLTLAGGVVDTGGTPINVLGALLAGSSGLTKNGAGTLVLSGTNVGLSGAVKVNQGALQIAATNALGAGTVTVASGSSVEFITGGNIANAFTISGKGVNNEGALCKVTPSLIPTNSGLITLETNVFFGGTSGQYYMQGGLIAASGVDANVVFGGAVSYRVSFGNANIKIFNLHAGSLTVNGPASLNTAATSLTYSNLVLNGGQFSSGLKDASFGTVPSAFNASDITMSNGANMLLSTTFTINANRGIYLGPGGGLFGANTASSQITIPGVISGPGSLLFETDGSGASWKLTADNTYTGTTTVQNGVGLVIGDNSTTTGSLGLGDTTNNGTITVNNIRTFTYAGAIRGTGTLTLQGYEAVLSGGSTYTGNTTDTGSFLLVNNTNASGTGTGALTVGVSGGGSVLGGTGIISGPVTIVTGNTLQPGDAYDGLPGTLAISNSLTLQPGSTSVFNVDATDPANTGVMGLTSVTYGGTLYVFIANGTPVAGQTYQLFQTASHSGTFEGGLALGGLPAGLAWNTSNFYVNGSISVVAQAGIFNPPVLSGTNFILSGTGGPPLGSFSVLSATNLTVPVSGWTVLSTGNSFDFNGDFEVTNKVDPAAAEEFFMLRQP